jgi:hypothetical protein
MNDRRLELGLRWADVTARGGPSVEQMGAIRRGAAGEIRDLTLAALAKGLNWPLEHVRELAADEGGGQDVARDAFEAAVLASALPQAEKAAAISRHRERMTRELAELGLPEVPGFIAQAVTSAADGDDEPGHRDARPA